MSEVLEGATQTLPADWHWTTMGEIAEVVGGGTPRTNEPTNFEGGDIPWITPADLSGYAEKYISHGARFITRRGLESSSAQLLPAGTVLFTSRAPIGYVAIARNSVATNQGFKSFVLKDGVLPEYVYWWLKGSKQRAEALASGTTFLELSGANARKIPIPIAPLDEQRRIVTEIEKQLSRLDEAVANLRRVKANLKRYTAAVLKTAVETWTVSGKGTPRRLILENVAHSIRNGYAKKPNAEHGTRILRISAVRPMELHAGDVRFLSDPPPAYEPFLVGAGDVLFVRYSGTREYVGAAAVVPTGLPPTVYPDKLIRVRLDPRQLLPSFLVLVAATGVARAHIESRIRTTAGQSGISGSDLKSLPLIVPTLGDQRDIINAVQRRLSIVRSLEKQLTIEFAREQTLRFAILSDLLTSQDNSAGIGTAIESVGGIRV